MPFILVTMLYAVCREHPMLPRGGSKASEPCSRAHSNLRQHRAVWVGLDAIVDGVQAGHFLAVGEGDEVLPDDVQDVVLGGIGGRIIANRQGAEGGVGCIRHRSRRLPRTSLPCTVPELSQGSGTLPMPGQPAGDPADCGQQVLVGLPQRVTASCMMSLERLRAEQGDADMQARSRSAQAERMPDTCRCICGVAQRAGETGRRGRGGGTRDKRGDGDGQDGSRGLAWDLSCGGFQRRGGCWGALSGALRKGRGCGRPPAVQALVGWADGWADCDIGLGRRAGRDWGIGGVWGAGAEGGRGGHLAEVCIGGGCQQACIDGAWGGGGSLEGATWGRWG